MTDTPKQTLLELAYPHRKFGCRVEGTCMAPAVEEDDILVVDFDCVPMHGGIVLVQTTQGPNLVRRLFLGHGGLHLRSDDGASDTFVDDSMMPMLYPAIAVKKPTGTIIPLDHAHCPADEYVFPSLEGLPRRTS